MDVAADAKPDPDSMSKTRAYEQRLAFARNVLIQPTVYAPTFQQALAAQSLDNTSADKQIIDMVGAVWNAVAGI
jgi:hypothetical protein